MQPLVVIAEAASSVSARRELVRLCAAGFLAYCSYAMCRSLLASASPPTAIVCATDAMAIGAIAACRERGVEVGKAMSIVGYGNSSASAFCDPPLTTIDHAVFENGRHIGQSLLGLLRGEAKPADIHYLEPVNLVSRSSRATGPKIRVPRGWRLASMMTQALSSKRM